MNSYSRLANNLFCSNCYIPGLTTNITNTSCTHTMYIYPPQCIYGCTVYIYIGPHALSTYNLQCLCVSFKGYKFIWGRLITQSVDSWFCGTAHGDTRSQKSGRSDMNALLLAAVLCSIHFRNGHTQGAALIYFRHIALILSLCSGIYSPCPVGLCMQTLIRIGPVCHVLVYCCHIAILVRLHVQYFVL